VVTASPKAAVGFIWPSLEGTATIGDRLLVRKAVPAEKVMQAFGVKHIVPTKEFIMVITKSSSFSLSTETPPGKVLEVPQGGEVKVVVKVSRKDGTKGPIKLAVDQPPKGVRLKAANIPANKDKVTISIVTTKQTPVGIRQNLIISGTLKEGKKTVKRIAPALPIKVVVKNGTK